MIRPPRVEGAVDQLTGTVVDGRHRVVRAPPAMYESARLAISMTTCPMQRHSASTDTERNGDERAPVRPAARRGAFPRRKGDLRAVMAELQNGDR